MKRASTVAEGWTPAGQANEGNCAFCSIVRCEANAAIVHQDKHTLAFMDLRQFNEGHVLVIPRLHLRDVRDLKEPVASALTATVVRVTRAVAAAFPSEGISLWHSIGPAAFQEVPHLHIHVHPRRVGDGMLQVYTSEPPLPAMHVRERYAALVRMHL